MKLLVAYVVLQAILFLMVGVRNPEVLVLAPAGLVGAYWLMYQCANWLSPPPKKKD